MCQFSRKTNNFHFFDPNLPKNEPWGQNFQNLSPDLESASPSSLTSQFSVNIDNFEFLDLNLGEIARYVRY